MPKNPPVDPAATDDELTVDPKAGETVRPDWAYDSCTEPTGAQESPAGSTAGARHDD